MSAGWNFPCSTSTPIAARSFPNWRLRNPPQGMLQPGPAIEIHDPAEYTRAGDATALMSRPAKRSWRQWGTTPCVAERVVSAPATAADVGKGDDHASGDWIQRGSVAHSDRGGAPAVRESTAGDDALAGQVGDRVQEGC